MAIPAWVIAVLITLLTIASWILIFCLKTSLIPYLWILIALYNVPITTIFFKLRLLSVHCIIIKTFLFIHLFLLRSRDFTLSVSISPVSLWNWKPATVILFFPFVIKTVCLVLFRVIRVSVQRYKIIYIS